MKRVMVILLSAYDRYIKSCLYFSLEYTGRLFQKDDEIMADVMKRIILCSPYLLVVGPVTQITIYQQHTSYLYASPRVQFYFNKYRFYGDK